MSSPAPILKPMNAGDILDQAIRIYRQNFIPLVSVVAIIQLPLVLLQVILALLTLPLAEGFTANSFDQDPTGFAIYYVGTFVFGLIGALATLILNGALTHFTSERFLARPVTVRQAYGKAFSRGLSLIIASILYVLANAGLVIVLVGVIMIPIFGVAILSGTSGGSSGNGPLAAVAGIFTLLACILIIPAVLFSIFLSTRWLLYTQAIVIENYNSSGGLGRSWKLVKGTFWRILGFNIILAIIVYAFTAGPILLLGTTSFFLPPGASVALNALAGSFLVILITPLRSAATTILYYDLRIRKEGFDLQFQMQAQAQLEPQAPSNDLPSLLSGPTF